MTGQHWKEIVNSRKVLHYRRFRKLGCSAVVSWELSTKLVNGYSHNLLLEKLKDTLKIRKFLDKCK